MQDERDEWDRKYREGSHTNLTPDPFLLETYENFIEPILGTKRGRSGTALDLAGGIGRHTLWLAERGWQVTLFDISAVGVDLAGKHARDRGMTINARICDLSDATWPERTEAYDLILVFFFLERSLFPVIESMIKPGGLLVYKTYTQDHPRLSDGKGPSHPMHLLASQELLRAFAGMQVLHYRETVKGRGVAEFVAIKPV